MSFAFNLFLTYSFLVLSFFYVLISEKSPQKFRFDGKYGLYVSIEGDHYQVHWLTSAPEEGYLNTHTEEVENLSYSTPKSIIHKVQIPLYDQSMDIDFGSPSGGNGQITIVPNYERDAFEFKGVDSVYVLGDTHGNFDEVVQILQNSKLIDENHQWIGGSVHLVFLGDILDRGKDALRLTWFIYELEQSAAQHGGQIHLILGNHEIMVMSNDLRYVSAKEQQVANMHQVSYQQLYHPTRSVLGRWLSTKPAALKIDGILFAHGGIIMGASLKSFNDRVYEYTQAPLFSHLMEQPFDSVSFSQVEREEQKDYLYDSFRPFWFRGYVQTDTLGSYLDAILLNNKAKLHVVGHTTVPSISSFYNGKLIATNVPKAGTEMLLLTKSKRSKYHRFRINLLGEFVVL
ncbi:MAG: metallophosphoesterase [Cytophagales bacterium]|tara:strand:- start:1424 stop:2626 length:1203 start_codon:yes stop_codon:yes gene_type:complete